MVYDEFYSIFVCFFRDHRDNDRPPRGEGGTYNKDNNEFRSKNNDVPAVNTTTKKEKKEKIEDTRDPEDRMPKYQPPSGPVS